MWVRGHSRSLKVVPFESLGTVSYSPSIVIMAVCLAISEIFNVKWPDLEIWVWGRSRWSTRSSAVAKRPRDASCLYSFYTLEWCGYPMVKKIPTYVYSFWHDPRTWKNRRFHVPQPTFLFPLETPLRLSRSMLHGWTDNSMLAKALAVCTYLSSIISELNDAYKSMRKSKNRYFYHIFVSTGDAPGAIS